MTDRPKALEALVDTLLRALTMQAGESGGVLFARNALDELAAQPREIVRILLGSIGHLVHYGIPDQDPVDHGLAQLFEQIVAALRRSNDRGAGGLLPGDLVELSVDRLGDNLKAGTVMRVYFIGEDGTADVGYEALWQEYVIYSVEIEQLRPRTIDLA